VKFIILALLAVFISPVAQADSPNLRDRQARKYLVTSVRIPTIQIRSTIPTAGMGAHTAQIPSTIPTGNMGAATVTTAPTTPYATNAPGIYGSSGYDSDYE